MIGGVLLCAVLWLILRLIQGRSLAGKRLELVLLRAVTLGLLALILFGPTIVDEQPGRISRPALMMVFDGSQSMQLGRSESRWDTATNLVENATQAVSDEDRMNCRLFQFGHQLRPFESSARQSDTDPVAAPTTAGTESDHPADATDSRLADALRQLLPHTTSEATAGVVLLSDGRVRASDTVEKLAEVFAESDIPIHVVPIGKSTGAGDVAVVSMVVPSEVRKYTENEIQVFLRSFGYSGQHTTVRIRRKSELQDETASFAEVPVTLRDGAQSVTLPFRIDEHPEELIVSVDPMDDELTDRNNDVPTAVGINRSKVRVLYVEGDPTSARNSSGPDSLPNSIFTSTLTDLDLKSALQADTDVECTMLVSRRGSQPRAVSEQESYTRGFPGSRAELFAYDCVIFSNVGPEVISEQQAAWLAQWIEVRGGGLIVAGADALQQEEWSDCPLLPLLPVRLNDTSVGPPQLLPVTVVEGEGQHPIWRLQLEERLNTALLKQIPPLSCGLRNAVAKPSAEVLAVEAESASPVLVTQRTGRGRVVVSTASLTGTALQSLADSWGSQPQRTASKLWRNIVYWATENSSTGRRRLIASSDKRFYRPGENLRISATAYDEAARQATHYRIWAMFEPQSLDDMSVYSPILWPADVARVSGEVGPRIAWGEELQLKRNSLTGIYELPLQLSEAGAMRDSSFRVEMTAYEGEETELAYSHGTQVDSTSLSIQILSDPFEQQNPLPNHELLRHVAEVSGGSVLQSAQDLADVLRRRPKAESAPVRDLTPAWDRWWLWGGLAVSLTVEWCRRRLTGLA